MKAAGAAEGALLPPGWRPARRRPAVFPAGRYRPCPPLGGWDGRLVLRDATAVTLRPLVATDREAVATAFERLSEVSRYRRFLSPMPRLTSGLLAFLTDIDQVNHVAWVAVVEEAGIPTGVGVARFVRLADPAVAEPAVTVIDAYQGRGLGGLLFDALVLSAPEHGITRFEGLVLAENVPSRAMLARTGARFERDGGDVLHFTVDLPARAQQLSSSPLHTALRRFPVTRGA